MERIAVLTSGGDAPGMNAAVRATVRAANAAGLDVVGVRDGFAGLIEGRVEALDARQVAGILHLGGTVLGTARSEEFRAPEGRASAARNLRDAGVGGLVVIGGEGTFLGADALADEHGVRTVGVPGTIDNDIAGTDFTIGFDTAVNTALDAIDRVRDTARSHNRLFVIEVMGRHRGWLALYAGIAGGASAVMVPERRTDLAAVRDRVRKAFEIGKEFSLVIAAEGDDVDPYTAAERIGEDLGVDARVIALGHVQRGGSPSMRDRILGARLGDAAVTAIVDDADRVMVGEADGKVVRVPFGQVAPDSDAAFDELLALMDRLAR